MNKKIMTAFILAMTMVTFSACKDTENEKQTTTKVTTTSATTQNDLESSEEITEEISEIPAETSAPEDSEETLPDITTTTESSEPAVDIIEVIPASDIANSIVANVKAQLDIPYIQGGISPETGFDGTGLIYYVAKQSVKTFPRQLVDQINQGTKVGYSDLQAGDIVYFASEPNGTPSFGGIYIGDGKMIYSPKPEDKVKEANITSKYWVDNFSTAIRLA